MPTYDYECGGCGHAYELFQSISAKPKRKCPSCGELKARRLIGTGGGIIFRGSGFYQTDYRSEGYKQAAKAEKESGSGEKKSDKAPSGEKSKTNTAGKSESDSGKS
jgi:putative FmdB family regulatory protein